MNDDLLFEKVKIIWKNGRKNTHLNENKHEHNISQEPVDVNLDRNAQEMEWPAGISYSRVIQQIPAHSHTNSTTVKNDNNNKLQHKIIIRIHHLD